MENGRPTILIADDSPENLTLLTEILKSQYRVIAATDGNKALQLAFSAQKPGLILLDILMPGLDGFEVCQRIKNNAATSEIPIIFITGLIDRQDIIKGFNAGAQDYVTKPFNPQELLARVKNHLDLKFRTEELKDLNATLEHRVNFKTRQIRKANQKLKELNEALDKANRQLLTLDRAKSKFIQIISHEIRTPLTGIMGFAELLQNSLEQDQYKEYINALLESAKRLDLFAQKALFITNLMTGEVQLTIQDICVKKLSEMVLSVLDATINNKKMGLINKIPESFTVKGDLDLTQIVLQNIIDNAVKFAEQNSEIIIQPSGQNGIEILNTGSQFSEEALQNLFKLFSYGYEPVDQNFGLGLSVARMIMELQKGSIEALNSDASQACVRLYFQ